MEEKIREVEKRDLDQLLALLHQLSPPSEEEKALEKNRLEGALNKMIESEDYFLCVLEKGGKLLGTGTLLVQQNLSHGGKPYGHIENVVVDEQHREKGVGKMVVEYLVERARQRNCYKVRLGCSRQNALFYGNRGFKKHGMEMRLDL